LRRSIIGYFDLCTGCRICELACSFAKFGVYNPRKSVIMITMQSEGLRAQPITCSQCENPYCARACPVDAIRRDEETGIVHVIAEKCTGCGWCVRCCPIEGVIKIEPTTGKAIKCDTCNEDPSCVRYCPTQALVLK